MWDVDRISVDTEERVFLKDFWLATGSLKQMKPKKFIKP